MWFADYRDALIHIAAIADAAKADALVIGTELAKTSERPEWGSLIDALRTSGYLEQQPVVAKEEKVRRMVRRLDLSTADAEVWLGMLRQVLWKMKPPN